MRGLTDGATLKSSESSFPPACTLEPHRTVRLKVLVLDIWQTHSQTLWSELGHSHTVCSLWCTTALLEYDYFLPHTLKYRLTFSLKTLVYTHYFYFKVTFHMTVLLEPNKHSLSNTSDSSRAFIGRPRCLQCLTSLNIMDFCCNSSSY